MLDLSTVRFLRREKKCARWNVFSFAEDAPKGCYGGKVAVIFFRWSPVCSQKMSVPSFSSFPLSQPWLNSLATTFFLPPVVLSLPNSSPLPSALILLRSALPAAWKGKQMALACVFCTLKGCEMMRSFDATLPVRQEGYLMLSAIIRNARLQPSGFTAFPNSHQKMTQGCTFLSR